MHEGEAARHQVRTSYEAELVLERARVQRSRRRCDLLANARLLVALGGLAIGWLAYHGAVHPATLAAPVVVFLGLVRWHQTERARRQAAQARCRYWEDGLARMDDRWAGRGRTGEKFQSDDHLYAADLDLFGSGGLFDLLSGPLRLPMGERILAQWLLSPAPPAEIQRRQAAVRELAACQTLRRDMGCLPTEPLEKLRPEELAGWGNEPAAFTSPITEPLLLACVTVSVALLMAAWSQWISLHVVVLSLIVQGTYAGYLGAKVRRVLRGVDHQARGLNVLIRPMKSLRGRIWVSAKLNDLQATLGTDAGAADQEILKLSRILEQRDWARNTFVAILAMLVCWTTRCAIHVDRWRGRFGPRIGPWLEALGEWEALLAFATYAHENPEDPDPEVRDAGPYLEVVALGHPLLPRRACVTNDVALGGAGVRLWIVSGSNMSGKSTFLRAVGTAVVMAQAGAPVRAERMVLSPLAVGATLRIQDSLQAGRSRFYAEILRLRELVRVATREAPLLFLIDEILHGTNSHDRRLGAEGILKGLLQRDAIGLATTHDLALTRLADDLGPRAGNVHFADVLGSGNRELTFDYRLRGGVVQHSNALALMRSVGLEV